LGKTPEEVASLPIDQRFQRYAKGEADPGFEALFFQFGRYLLISSSRPGGLPANLQGVWNQLTKPAWRGDYHSNINIQMNYWPAELTNLSECHVPLFNFVAAQAPVYRKNMLSDPQMAKRLPQPPWLDNPHADRCLRRLVVELNIPANAWYCQHLLAAL
jgi:alpha-L-fucosidase 2